VYARCWMKAILSKSIFHKSFYPHVIANYLTEKFNLYEARARLASAILHSKAQECKSPIEYVNLSKEIFCKPPLNFIGWPIKASQIPEEIEALLHIVKEHDVVNMLEIGSFNGGTLFLFARMSSSKAKIISLDLPGAAFGSDNENLSRTLFSNFATDKQIIYSLREDSHLNSSLKKVESILAGERLDFVFIDGDHSYEGVKKDFEMYSPLVRKGGFVAFHDICKHPPETGVQVHQFYTEIKSAYKHTEIIAEPETQNWAGIGVIHM
jgi:predicted O-methyltransferase YrrM